MGTIRAFFHDHRRLTALLVALTLCLKVLVPQGYMIGTSRGQKLLTVQLCLDGIAHKTIQIAVPTDGKQGDGDKGSQGKDGGHCAFSSLGFDTLANTDPVQMALALLFILTLGFAPVAQILGDRQTYLRPPLRGPPAFI